MILLTSQLLFESSGQRVLTSIVYDEVGDRFVRVSQKISAELTEDLSAQNPMVDIMDVISLDYIDYELTAEEIEEVFEKFNDDFNRFEDVGNKSHRRPDICAFVLLDKLVPSDKENDIIVGGMVFRTEQDTLWIVFSFVHPDYRGLGIYQRMFEHIETYAKTTLKSKRITSMVSVENKAQISASRKVGMFPAWYRMFKKLG